MGRHREREYEIEREQMMEEPVLAHLIVPVFGVAAAAAIAFYTKYLEEARLRSMIMGGSIKKTKEKAYKMDENMVDSLPRTKTTLIKSRSAFV